MELCPDCEPNYRRGYTDGFLAGIDAFVELLVKTRHSSTGAYDQLYNFWDRDLARWAYTNLRETIDPPTPEIREARRSPTIRGRQQIFRRDKGICGICGTPVDPKNWAIDHIMPRSKGGTDDWHNLRVAHPECNSRKKDRFEEPT